MTAGSSCDNVHIETCRDLILNFYLPQVRIPELFLPNIQELTAQFEARIRSEPLQDTPKGEEKELLGIIQVK